MRRSNARDRPLRPRAVDRDLLQAIVEVRRRPGRPSTLAVALGEEAGRSGRVRPYLLQLGFLQRRRAADRHGSARPGAAREASTSALKRPTPRAGDARLLRLVGARRRAAAAAARRERHRRTSRSRRKPRRRFPSGMPAGSAGAQRHVPIAVPYSSRAATTTKTAARARWPAPEEEQQQRHAERAGDVAGRRTVSRGRPSRARPPPPSPRAAGCGPRSAAAATAPSGTRARRGRMSGRLWRR
jgi:hypothetical protein